MNQYTESNLDITSSKYKQDNEKKDEDFTKSLVSPKFGFISYILEFTRKIFVSNKNIGELNGRWATFFKIGIITLFLIIPSLFSWGVWVTHKIHDTEYHITDTNNYGKRINKIESTLSRHEEYLLRLERLEQKETKLEKKFNVMDKKNVSDHARILTMLEFIKKEVEK